MMQPELEQLRADEVHLWFVVPEEVEDPALLDRYFQILNPAEREQQQRFYFPQHRRQYLVSHALVRTTLSRYAPIAPEAWAFSKNRYGRPDVDHADFGALTFNLSHTDGLAVCGVVWNREFGVDVEDCQRRGQTVEIAESFFAATEVTELRSQPLSRQRDRFFDYWTLKESYIKARGMGLSLPLDQFAFGLAGEQPIRISFDPRLVDDPTSWQFALLSPTARHRAAVCTRHPITNPPLRIVARQVVPLVEGAVSISEATPCAPHSS